MKEIILNSILLLVCGTLNAQIVYKGHKFPAEYVHGEINHSGGYHFRVITNKDKSKYWGEFYYECSVNSNTGKEFYPCKIALGINSNIYIKIKQADPNSEFDYGRGGEYFFKNEWDTYDKQLGSEPTILTIPIVAYKKIPPKKNKDGFYSSSKYHYYFNIPKEISRGHDFWLECLRYPQTDGSYYDLNSTWDYGSYWHDIWDALETQYNYMHKMDVTKEWQKTDPTYGM